MSGLVGKRILVVEDESLVAMLIETILEDLGCKPVGPASSVDDALQLITSGEAIDAALLDVNVGGHQVYPVAEALKTRGVPFVFSTGYGEAGLTSDWRGRPTLQKPFTEDAVEAAIRAALSV